MGRRTKEDVEKALKVTISFSNELVPIWDKTDKSFLITVLLQFANTFDDPKDATDYLRTLTLERQAVSKKSNK
jgi:hypothetical protein